LLQIYQKNQLRSEFAIQKNIPNFAPLKLKSQAVDHRRQFLISFGGLKAGIHEFEFDIDDRFFENFEYSEIKKGSLKVLIEIEKQERMLILNFSISGFIETTCDRCLDVFPLSIEGKYPLFVKFGSDFHEESDDVIVIPQHETRFDAEHYIYEFITLLVPIRHVHPQSEDGTSGCDPLILKKIEELKHTEKSDSRWEILKKLKK
jgi:uncharacterized metal-binding protein YceD (DUF177 family)